MKGNFACPGCGHRYGLTAQGRIISSEAVTCRRCDRFDDVDSLDVLVDDGSKIFLQRKSVLTAEWFHYTMVENWLDEVRAAGVWVHVGTMKSVRALRRHRMDYKGGGSAGRYVHTLRLSKAVVDPGVAVDRNWWPEKTTDRRVRVVQDVDERGAKYRDLAPKVNVVRYLNRWEAPGNISLLVDPQALEVVSTRKMRRNG